MIFFCFILKLTHFEDVTLSKCNQIYLVLVKYLIIIYIILIDIKFTLTKFKKNG